MVNLPSELVINSTLVVGAMYKFEAPELIDISTPHYFIVVAIDGSEIFMVLCTSQGAKKERYFTNKNLDFNTLVYIKPDSNNRLTADTYVNCNDYYPITKNELISKLEAGKLDSIGNISLNHYLQIKKGIIESYTNDLPEYLLVYPQE